VRAGRLRAGVLDKILELGPMGIAHAEEAVHDRFVVLEVFDLAALPSR